MTPGGQTSAATASLFESYRTRPGVPDELCDAEGRMRPGWAPLLAHLSGQTTAQLEASFARGDRHLADAGVFFRNYDDDAEGPTRDWPFSPIPVVLQDSEWADIASGLTQRANLMEAVVADLYGDNRLVADGHLPAKLIAENPEWLRPMVGVKPRGGHFLHFCAFEIGRGPDGRWWVLSDRTDAPSGAGFALENRVAANHVFPRLNGQMNVERLAGFFRNFRDALAGLNSDGATRAAILTPGPHNDTYYEQAYIARYLGMNLLEGGDLTVDDGALKVRTVKGLMPVEVLWRRMDSTWSDPLELRSDSQLGTPGLLSAVRNGTVTMINALGVGVLESQALMAFLPQISRVLTGEALTLPNVATWWCGHPDALSHVRANAKDMMIGPAMSTRMPFETAAPHAIAGKMQGDWDGDVESWLAIKGPQLVAKQLVKLSTTPVYNNGQLEPRPMSLRVFLARTATGWQVMPGGFARIGSGGDKTDLSMQNGGSAADVWVTGTAPVAKVSLLHTDSAAFQRPQPGALPSHAADNLFWLGRYIERVEGVLRLLRAYHTRDPEGAGNPLLATIANRLSRFNVDVSQPLPDGLRTTFSSALRSARQIRDRFSVDGWAALRDMEQTLDEASIDPNVDLPRVISTMLRKLAGFSGLVHENMYRAAGWHFLTMGRALERATSMTDLLATVTAYDAAHGGLDLAIEIGDSLIIHRQRHAVQTSRDTVIDQLALDGQNPRSVLFQLDTLLTQLTAMTIDGPIGHMTNFERSVRTLQTAFKVHSVATLDTSALRQAHQDLLGLSVTLNDAFLR